MSCTLPSEEEKIIYSISVTNIDSTHGWLEGHIKEQNYGADWGDFVSFVKHINQTAINNDVDLLLVDTGDLHDGAGLSDATMPNGNISNAIFENLNYDLLTIGVSHMNSLVGSC